MGRVNVRASDDAAKQARDANLQMTMELLNWSVLTFVIPAARAMECY
jgi:hypothetical protein